MASPLIANTWVARGPKDTAAIARQSGEIADLFAAFVNQAQRSLHIAIYDFRLNPQLASTVMGALNAASERGVDVRVAYFQQPPRKNTNQDGGDPSPGTRATDLKALRHGVAIKAIKGIDISALPKGVKKEPIEGGGHLMHSKYMVRDGEAVWTGSANFTTDAWSIQDNNIVQLISPDIAKCYSTDFDELWASGRIAGTGKNDLGSTTLEGYALDVAFSPGDGSTVEKEIAGAVQGAKKTVAMASMVISSGAILGALIDAMARGVRLTGVYDGPQMNVVLRDWAKSSKSVGKAAQWEKIKGSLIAKASTPYTPSGPHDFMHNKLAVVDAGLVVTGSFNFSQNATMNAENLLTIRDPGIVAEYAKYVDQLVSTYGSRRASNIQVAARARKRANRPSARSGK